jgi:ankyrin repeat protein
VATAVGFGDTATVRALLDNGASANEADRNGDTLLNFAAFPNHVGVAQLLLERGADEIGHLQWRPGHLLALWRLDFQLQRIQLSFS